MSNVISLEISCFGLASRLYFAQAVTSGASKVADTGPLLALARIEAPGLLRELYQLGIMDSTVYTEAVTAGLAIKVTHLTRCHTKAAGKQTWGQ